MSRVWLDGRLVDEAEAAVSVHDRGFTLGDGVFETMRAYAGHVFRLDDHLERLGRGARRLGIPLAEHDLTAAVRETLAANALRDAAVRLTLSRGPAAPGLEPPGRPAPTVVVTARPYAPPERWYRRGLSAIYARGRVNEHAATAGLKTLGYAESVVALAEARARGVDEALRLDTAGHLAAGSASNLFLVADGALHTPPEDCGILPGITRAVVLSLTRELGIPVHQAPLEPAALEAAAEAFLTNSLRELVPLVAVESRPIGTGAPGPVTGRLLRAYRDQA